MLLAYHHIATRLKNEFDECKIKHIAREENVQENALANHTSATAMKNQRPIPVIWIEELSTKEEVKEALPVRAIKDNYWMYSITRFLKT